MNKYEELLCDAVVYSNLEIFNDLDIESIANAKHFTGLEQLKYFHSDEDYNMTFMTRILRNYPELNVVQADMIAEDCRVIVATEKVLDSLELADEDLIELAMSRRLDLLG